jgi:hypothetical protein
VQQGTINRHILGKGTIDRRSREEHHIRAKVIASTTTELTLPTGNAWFNDHELTLSKPRPFNHLSYRFVTWYIGLINHKGAKFSLSKEVDVRSTKPIGQDLHQDLMFLPLWYRNLFQT